VLLDGHAGGQDALVGGEPGGKGEEALGADDGGFEIDAVDGEEVRVEVVEVVGDPGVVG
jgi:hypothetical protein